MAAVDKRVLTIILLTKQELKIAFEGRKAKLRDIYQQACDHLGLKELEFCGLAELLDGEYRFLDLDMPVVKFVPKKVWKSALQDGAPMMQLHLRIRLYVDHVSFLRDKVTRHLYYLQLRDNLLEFRHLLSDETYFLLAAYALQADLGSFNSLNTDSYFEPKDYFPSRVIERYGRDYILSHLPALHGDLQDMTKSQAATQFIRLASQKPWTHNLHFYWLKRRKTDPQPNTWLALAMHALEIYEEVNGYKSLLSAFPWGEITKLHSEKKLFEIRASGAEDRKFVYHTGSEQRSKYLLQECQLTHRYYMSVRPRLMEQQHMEQRDRWYETRSSTSGSIAPATPSRADVSDHFNSAQLSSSVRSSMRSSSADIHSRTLPATSSRIHIDRLTSPVGATGTPFEHGSGRSTGPQLPLDPPSTSYSMRASLRVSEIRNSIRRPPPAPADVNSLQGHHDGWQISSSPQGQGQGRYDVVGGGPMRLSSGRQFQPVNGHFVAAAAAAPPPPAAHQHVELGEQPLARGIGSTGEFSSLYQLAAMTDSSRSVDKQLGVMRSASEGQHAAAARLYHSQQQAALRRTSEVVVPRMTTTPASGAMWPEKQFALPIIGPQLALPVVLDNRPPTSLNLHNINGRHLAMQMDAAPPSNEPVMKPPPLYSEAVRHESIRLVPAATVAPTMPYNGDTERPQKVVVNSNNNNLVDGVVSLSEPSLRLVELQESTIVPVPYSTDQLPLSVANRPPPDISTSVPVMKMNGGVNLDNRHPSMERDKVNHQSPLVSPPPLSIHAVRSEGDAPVVNGKNQVFSEQLSKVSEQAVAVVRNTCPIHMDKMDEIRRAGDNHNTPFLKGLVSDRSLCTCGRDSVFPQLDNRAYAIQAENNLRRDISRSNNRLAEVPS